MWRSIGIVLCIALLGTGGALTAMAIADDEGWDREAQSLGAAIFAFLTGLALAALVWLVMQS
jgi:hypothetical protein